MVSWMSSGSSRTSPFASAASTIAAATTWCEACSREPASRSTSSGALAGRRLDGDQARAADRERARLVEHDGVGARERLERAAALDENALARRLGDAGDEGDRRGQDERARRRRDQHREPADRIARQQPGRAGDEQRDGQEQQGVAVGQTDERRLRGLRRRDQAHDARIGALARRRGGAHLEGLAGIERAAARGLALAAVDRDRLSRQRRLVEHGARAGDHAVHRHDLAGAHQDGIADRDLLDGDVLEFRARLCGARPSGRGRPGTSDRARRARRRSPPARCRRHT